MKNNTNNIGNNCGTFALDVISVDDDIDLPSIIINNSPINILSELIEEGHKSIEYKYNNRLKQKELIFEINE